MTIIDPHHRRAFLFGREAGIRSTSSVLDQVEEQLRAERVHVRELERDIAVLRRDLEAARLALCQRDTTAAFAAAPSPSKRVH